MFQELFTLSPDAMTAIAALSLVLVIGLVFGLVYSRYTRRLALAVLLAAGIVLGLFAALAFVRLTFFPMPHL